MERDGARNEFWHGVRIITLLSVFALAVQGYHPYAEDGGLYVAGIKKVLDPTFFPVLPEFVLAHMRFSPFAAAVAGIARVTHVPLPWVLLALYGASIWATLYAGWMVACRCVESNAGRLGAVVLLACWLSMPIAGTSLLLMDPYVTARSISTPLALLAVAWALDAMVGSRRSWVLCGLALVLALVHPLMAGYAVATIIVLAVVGSSHAGVRHFGPVALLACALVVANTVESVAPHESADYVAAALTRQYWFPFNWQWYEQIGLVAPLLLLAVLFGYSGAERRRTLARMALSLGIISMLVALAFARVGLNTHLVARLQPLRLFQAVYEVMILLLGAWLGERWLGHRAWRWGVLLAVLGGVMFYAERQTYPASDHFEFPGQPQRNLWAQAFVWARGHTPRDAVFALDAHYITRDGEDAQGFRGIAERTMLPDYSKDGGEASITPELASAWVQGQAAQSGLDDASDETRGILLRPLGVTWVVLAQQSHTDWRCPYGNAAAKVCQLP